MPRPIAIDLFAGAGGMSLGFEQAGFDVVGAVEIDPIHCATHEFNFPNTRVICKSIVEITGDEIKERCGVVGRDVDVVFGGPPCQGVSLMGKRALDDPRNELMRHFVRVVTEIRPRYFVMENVKGLTVGEAKQILVEVMSSLEAAGYDVVSNYRVLNAADFGVPQDRQRVFLIGGLRGLRPAAYPAPTTCKAGTVHSARHRRNLPVGPTVGDALGDLPDVDAYPELMSSDSAEAAFGAPSEYARRLRFHADPADYSYPRRYNSDVITSSLLTSHTEVSIARFRDTPPGTTEAISHFPRLDPLGVCNTLRAGTGSDRGAHTSPRPIHPTAPRCITVREAARLHSYPDWFRFHVTKWHGFRQIGNSVPPLLARAVASSIFSVLGAHPSHPCDPIALGSPSLLNMDMTAAAAYYGVHKAVTGRRQRKKAEDAEPELQNEDEALQRGGNANSEDRSYRVIIPKQASKRNSYRSGRHPERRQHADTRL